MRKQQGFTIVELLIVIIVIGILASITIILYNGIQERARVAVLQSDLESASKSLETYKFGTSTSEKYPSDLTAANLKASGDTHFTYQVNNATTPSVYCLSASNGGSVYRITSSITNPSVGSCSGITASGVTCPSNFLVVPGNNLFGTDDFCVMKYEAKQSSATVPISQANGTPWASISQVNAISYSANVAGCTGCHLITEAEWMTIAANVLLGPSNWSGGSVGSGSIYQGHVNNNPASAIAASNNDNDGQYGMTGGFGGAGLNNRRTLVLTNGEIIWDFSGNLWEWTSGTIAGGQQPGLSGESGYNIKEWNNSSLLWGGLPSSSRANAVASISALSAVNTWTSAQGIGVLYSDYGQSTLRSYMRGGNWSNALNTGVLSLFLTDIPSATYSHIGFRVAK